MSEILTQRRGHLGLITLNRPKSLNALNADMCHVIMDALLQWRDDPQIAQVAIVGAGDRAFCAGGDIVAIYRDIMERNGSSEEFWRVEYQLNVLIDEYPKPYIAFMDGIVLGGGIGISAHGSHRIVTEASRCGMPEVGIGFFPDVGGTHLLSRAPRAAGRLAALTGMKFGAADTVALGLADTYVPQKDLPALLEALQTEPVDRAVSRFAGIPDSGYLLEEWVQSFSESSIPAVAAELSAFENPRAAAALAALEAACPSSVRLVEELLREAGVDLRADLIREFRAAVHRLDDPDFAEGIRAAVIDKDRKPRWNEPLDKLSPEQRTARHFGPLEGAELDFTLIDQGLREKSGR
ncbi:3-hydroxyisobutyryl-CoA hydrolase [Glutamicibacter protophormiae]|uniref:3-hydroxyisobutyryl-CoA hydrolase n=1 Tax=Glutamicibacter protophormiae TaxID=37930 RepID=UPI00195D5FAB|nr:3-hydroxyisobutyryl-CoA hydrolase [Glutamicibacter protophormiae]QRQ78878.1 enoyl-CoA hydratase/isomerase family protein [Glutamicibacter protophormiae]